MPVTEESLQKILLDVKLPASVEDFRNPTEAFMINIITVFFQHFHIDVATIKRTTPEQDLALRVTDPENANIVSLINLREAMFIIGNKIFIMDFSINDFTSPGPKRTRKHLKLLANFIMYARLVKIDIDKRIDEIFVRGQCIDDLRKKKYMIIEASNTRAAENARKKNNNENLRSKIEAIRSRIESKNKEISKLEEQSRIREQNKQQAIERNQAKRAEVKKLEEITVQLKAKIVKEPKSIELRLRELEETCKSKKEKRTTVQEAIQSKKPLIRSLENAFVFIEKQHKKLHEVIDLQKKLMESNQMQESLKRQIEEATRLINPETNRDREDKEKVTEAEYKKCESECDEKLSKLRNLHNELLTEKKSWEIKMADVETRDLELNNERDKIRNQIVEFESEIIRFLRQCQNLYYKEIKDMEILHDSADNQIQSLYGQLSDGTINK